MNMHETSTQKERVLLIGIDTGDTTEAERSISELERLADTAQAETVASMLQKRSEPHPATYLGEGKIDEIKQFCEENEIDLIIADDELTGSQTKNLEDRTDVRVIDRTMLILDIFAMRAESSQGRLQVELAQLKYRLPRLAGLGKSLSRIGGGGKGGIATRGPGETKLETDRRHINRRIYALQGQIKEADKRRDVSGRRRSRGGVPTCALVGYTNAGKSTLMNTLCGADVYAEDKLFATLDPTVRRMNIEQIPAKDILLVDTVGFIRKLPHTLVEAFRSTLDESLGADMLLHVVDCSDEEAPRHIEIVETLLGELGAAEKPLFLILNKSDLCENGPAGFAIQKKTHENMFYVSARTGEGIEELRNAIIKHFDTEREYDLIIPYSDGSVLNILYQKTKVLSADSKEDGTHMKIRTDASFDILNRIEPYIVTEEE
ncbi:MAG: GTPase HflX [Clostridia bacterium]|nr:GTPase HflX [Clostridia bacterium]